MPLFFDNAIIQLCRSQGGADSNVIPIIQGIIQVFSSAFILVCWSCSIWWLPLCGTGQLYGCVHSHYEVFELCRCALIVIGLIAIPQIQYRLKPDTYFLETEDWEECKRVRAEKAAK